MGKEKVILLFIALDYLFMHFSLFQVFNSYINFPHFVLLIALVYYLKKNSFQFDARSIIMFCFLAVFPFVSFFILKDTSEFFKTYFMYLFLITLVLFLLPYLKKLENEKLFFVLKWTANFITLAALFGCLQFIYTNITGKDSLYNIFGSFTFMTQRITIEHQLIRPDSVYHEPSIFGWILNLGLVILLLEQKMFKSYIFKISLLINIIASVLTFSSSAYINMLILVVLTIVLKRNKPINKIFISFVLAICIGFVVFNASFVIDRISKLNEVGTSSYYRIVAPLRLMSDTLTKHPITGIGLGQIEMTVSKYSYMINGKVQGSTLDNGVIQIIVYFGIWGFLFFFAFLVRVIHLFRKNRLTIIPYVYLFLVLSETGEVFTVDFVGVLIAVEVIQEILIRHGYFEMHKKNTFINDKETFSA